MAIQTDGTEAYISIADNASLDIGTDDFSWAYWLYVTATPAIASDSLWNKDPDGDEYYENLTTSGTITIGNLVDAVTTTTGTAPQGAWTHLAWTRSGGTAVLYINGAVDKTVVGTANDSIDSVTALTFSKASEAYVNAAVEDYRWINKVLSLEEVSLLASGYRGPIGGEVLWLSLTESRGAFTGTLTQGTHTLPDLSVNSNDGDPYVGCVLFASECPRYGVAV